MNNLKLVFLMTVLTVIFVLMGNMLAGSQGMVFAFIIAVAMNFGAYWFSDRMVLSMYKAREIARADNPEIFQLVEDLATRAGLPMPRLYVIPSEQPNAFATGRDPQHAAVAMTEGIIRLLPKEELRGVLGHELSHVLHRDMLIGTVAATFAGAISMIAQMAQWTMIFGSRRSEDDEGGNPVAGLVMMIVAPLSAMLIQMAISRSREFLADEGGAQLCGNPLSLANALRKLEEAKGEIPMRSTPATAHLFIVNPLSGQSLMKLFSTHPPMEERIAWLEAMVYGRHGV